MAKVKARTKFAGAGCLVQGLGLVLGVVIVLVSGGHPLGLVFGALVLLGMLVAGSAMSRYFVCSECGNRVGDRRVKVCPVCQVELGR